MSKSNISLEALLNRKNFLHPALESFEAFSVELLSDELAHMVESLLIRPFPFIGAFARSLSGFPAYRGSSRSEIITAPEPKPPER